MRLGPWLIVLALASIAFSAANDDGGATQPATRPTAVLIVESGNANVAYRGWPVRITYRALANRARPATAATTVPTTAPPLSIKGPSIVTPQPAPGPAGNWFIPPDHSKAMTAGTYVCSAGAISATFELADEPPQLSPDLQDARRIAFLNFAVAQHDAAGAERIARAWIADSPTSIEAHAALGDALAAAGKPDEALEAYNEALNGVPPGVKPPRSLFAKAAAIRRQVLTTLPSRDAEAPTADEVAYYRIIDEGDALLAKGKFPDALRAYARAQEHFRARKLTLSPDELDQKIAYARQQEQKRPTTKPR
jgi:hypothetical protein